MTPRDVTPATVDASPSDADVLAVEALIATRGGVTFVEIEQVLTARGVLVRGDQALLLENAHIGNVVLWANMSPEFLAIMQTLQRRRVVAPTPTSMWTYLADGQYLRLPLAKQARRYKTEHWLPVAFSVKTR